MARSPQRPQDRPGSSGRDGAPARPVEPEYISREGWDRLAAELDQLHHGERPRVVTEVSDAAAQGDRSENAEYIYGKKRLREIDRRMRFLRKRLDVLQVLEGNDRTGEGRCFFGAWVTIEHEDGEERRYRILGVDEVDLAQGHISYRSPLGRALLGKQEGDDVRLMTPAGEREVVVTSVQYPARKT